MTLIPTVYGKVTKKRGGHWVFRFRCGYCGITHTHGWSPDPNAMRHRVAHCHDNHSPYARTGYFIAVGMPEASPMDRHFMDKMRCLHHRRKIGGDVTWIVRSYLQRLKDGDWEGMTEEYRRQNIKVLAAMRKSIEKDL